MKKRYIACAILFAAFIIAGGSNTKTSNVNANSTEQDNTLYQCNTYESIVQTNTNTIKRTGKYDSNNINQYKLTDSVLESINYFNSEKFTTTATYIKVAADNSLQYENGNEKFFVYKHDKNQLTVIYVNDTMTVTQQCEGK